MANTNGNNSSNKAGDINFTSKLWQAADKMRNNMDAAEDIKKISNTYHAFRGISETRAYQSEALMRVGDGGAYEDAAGFCKVANLEEIKKQGYILTPGRYVGTKETEEDDEVFEEKMKRLTAELSKQITEEKMLNEEIKKQLKSIRFEL